MRYKLSKELRNDFPRNLMSVVLQRDYDGELPTNETIQEVLGTLEGREPEIILFRLRDGMSLEEVANHYGRSPERIRQIEAKALRKLKHPTRLRVLQGIVPVNAYMQGTVEDKKKLSIDDLDLSVRAYTCLYRAGILTVEDILNADLIHVRNLGKKSFAEIVNRLSEMGFQDEMSKYKEAE